MSGGSFDLDAAASQYGQQAQAAPSAPAFDLDQAANAYSASASKPAFAFVPPHPAPDGSGAETNLSDADYAKFVAGDQPDTKATTSKTPSTDKNTKPINQNTIQGLTDEAAHGATLGLSDYAQAAGGYLGDAAISAVTGKDMPKFSDELQSARDPRMQLEQDHPAAALAAGAAGSGVVAPLVGPLFGSAADGAGIAAKGANYARNVAASAGLGGAQGYVDSGGDFNATKQGAETGAVLGAALPVAGAIAGGIKDAAVGAKNALSPLVSQSARDSLAGQQLQGIVGDKPIDTASIPGVQLDLAQATNSPDAAAQVRTLNKIDGTPGLDQQATNNQALTDALQGPGGVARPASVADASGGLTKAVRGTDDIVSAEGKRLWNAPELTQATVPVAPVAQTVRDSIENLRQTQPYLAGNMNNGVGEILSRLDQFPENATIQQINGLRSELLEAGRTASANNNFREAKAANQAASMVMDGMQAAIDSAETNNPGSTAGIRDAYDKARQFTAQSKTILGTDDANSSLRENAAGNFRKDASLGADAFFNFKRGSGEGAENLQQMRDMLGNIQQEWQSTGHTTSKGLNANDVARVRSDLADHTADYVVARGLDAAKSTVLDAQGNPNLSPNALNKFIQTNKPWMTKSGLFNGAQLSLLDRVGQTAEMLGRAENLRAGTNSATAETLLNPRFIDNLVSPTIKRMVNVGGTLAGYIHGGFEGAAAGGFASEMLNRVVNHASDNLKEIMSAALRNPQIAADLMQKAGTPSSGFSTATKAFLKQLDLAGRQAIVKSRVNTNDGSQKQP